MAGHGSSPGDPGRLAARQKRLLVACGDATALEAIEVQIEGRKRVAAEAFLNGVRLNENELLGAMGA